MKKDLSIIIVSFNTKKLTTECIKSIHKYTKNITYEIIVIDNASDDGSVATLKKLKKVTVVSNKSNGGFGRANNQGIGMANGRYILFLNSDTLISENVLGSMVSWMERHEKVGISSCKLLNSDGTTQGTGGYFPTLIRVFSWMTIQDFPLVDRIIKPFHPMKERSFSKADGFYEYEREIDWVTGAFMMVRSEVFDDVPGFDEDYFMYTEEVDFCYRAAKHGWETRYVPRWSIIHYGGASSNPENSILKEFEGIKLYYKKHYSTYSYHLLRIILKIGAIGRIVVFGLKDGKKLANVYVRAFKSI